MNGEIAKSPSISAGNHVIGRFEGDPNGPTLIAFGSIHGNEAAGALALERVAKRIEENNVRLGGRIYLLAGNTRALLRSVRFIDTDLNRHWTVANVEKNSEAPGSLAEDTSPSPAGSSLRTADNVSAAVSRWKARWPLSIS